jgi:glycosyltransferase involved in cell wall biosynthesis
VLIIRDPSPEEISNRLAGAFAVIQLFNIAGGLRSELEAMRSSIPVISTCGEKERPDYFDSAALYTKNTEAGIAEQMMRLYKDENTYREFSERAHRFAIEFSWHSTSETLYRIAEEAVAQRL